MKEKQDTVEKRGYRLFLDDVRQPQECASYMHSRIGARNPIYLEDWEIVRNYDEFIKHIEENGIPEFVSYDHDLADIHYDPRSGQESFAYDEKSGHDCAIWLNEYCKEKGERHPDYVIHSLNPVGAENIKNYLKYEG